MLGDCRGALMRNPAQFRISTFDGGVICMKAQIGQKCPGKIDERGFCDMLGE